MMKLRRFAAGCAAAFTLLAAAPFLRPAAWVSSAETETEASLTDWVPDDYDSAAACRTNNILIHDDLLCIVSTEYDSHMTQNKYTFTYPVKCFEPVSSALYDIGGDVSFRVDVLKAIRPGFVYIYHSHNLVRQTVETYTFSIDNNLHISTTAPPDWLPQDFDSALSFYNQFGKTHIRDNLLCTVFHETFPDDPSVSIDVKYALSHSCETLRELRSVRYQNGSDSLLVSLYEPAVPGEAYVFLFDTDQDESPYEYTFAINEDLQITETDLCAWVPDCCQEFYDQTETDGAVLTHGGDIAFLLQTTGGTGYSWQEAANDPELAEQAACFDCSELQICSDGARPSGGKNLEARVYHAKQDGQLELRLDLMPPGRNSEPADSLGSVMQITCEAGMVLLPGEARLTLLNADTGKPVISPFDQDEAVYIDYLAGKESRDPENFNESQFVKIRTAVSKIPLGSLFANEEYWLRINSDALPQGYRCDAVYANGACDSGDAITVKMFTDEIADITVRLDFSAQGDMNDDCVFDIADVVMLQRFLENTLSEPAFFYWKAGDFVNDDRLDARDLSMMKQSLLRRAAAIEENGLLLTLHTSYGGTGIMGQDLGSGSYDTEFYIMEGDVFYECLNGHFWTQNVRHQNFLPILTVEKIEADTVTVSVVPDLDGTRTEKTFRIGEPTDFTVHSNEIVYDGVNYSYGLRFDRIPAAAE